ncbi:MAG TPA: AI-2E family transporter [Gammaproteobacteria bacterium]|nr:AI-2E family transporter [Gammaproteobacteria bacterium]
MSFSLSQFYQLNRRIIIWILLFALLWLARDFFGLIFMTFVLAFIAEPLAELGRRRLRLPHGLSLSVVYALFVAVLVGFTHFVVPDVVSEANRLVGNLSQIEQRVIQTKNGLVREYPVLRDSISVFTRSAMDEEAAAALEMELQHEKEKLGLTEADLAAAAADQTIPPPDSPLARYYEKKDRLLVDAIMSEQIKRIGNEAPRAIHALYSITATLLLALLFSFLILVDIARLRQQVQDLGVSRVKDVYAEAAQPVVRFAYLLGRAIQAQTAIAAVYTVLTLAGLLLLKIPSVTMLSLVVFVTSFIPVLGVFISAVPIILVALNAGGLNLALASVGLIIIIHVLGTYLINPWIYGQHLNLNPVLTLIILFVAYHAFGLWGMILAVPVARYFIYDVLDVPLRGNA